MDCDSTIEGKFLRLLRENRPKILKICRVYAWGGTDQEDLYQEIVFQIWRALPNLKEDQFANTWLYRVALNTAITFVRKDKSRREKISPSADQELLEAPAPQDGKELQKNEQLEEMFAAISKLEPLEKAVITLFLEDLPYEQIAAVMGITESNVGVMLHRAKKKLSSLMKERP